jgi:branched-chain amino acid transport system ATP-binding protein
MLSIEGLRAEYGRARVLHDVALSVAAGEVVALLGRNGAGKSTTLKCVMRLVKPSAGVVRLEGRDISRLPTHAIAAAGVGYVPEDRRIFTDLSVRENLEVGRHAPRAARTPWTSDRVLSLFPELQALLERRADRISGGEQRMLTVGRALMGQPAVMLLDEPSEGLAPVVVQRMARMVGELKRGGLSVLMSEQNLVFAREVADTAVIIEQGRIRFRGAMAELAADETLARQYLAV